MDEKIAKCEYVTDEEAKQERLAKIEQFVEMVKDINDIHFALSYDRQLKYEVRESSLAGYRLLRKQAAAKVAIDEGVAANLIAKAIYTLSLSNPSDRDLKELEKIDAEIDQIKADIEIKLVEKQKQQAAARSLESQAVMDENAARMNTDEYNKFRDTDEDG